MPPGSGASAAGVGVLENRLSICGVVYPRPFLCFRKLGKASHHFSAGRDNSVGLCTVSTFLTNLKADWPITVALAAAGALPPAAGGLLGLHWGSRRSADPCTRVASARIGLLIGAGAGLCIAAATLAALSAGGF